MNLFKLLFLYFLSFAGFFCYGDSFNRVVATQWGAVNPSHYLNGNSMYYIVSAQKWNKLPDEIKTDVFQITPEQIRAFFDYHGLDERDMVAHYIGSIYAKATVREKGLGIDMTVAPHQNLQFYLTEPIGGGGGAVLASMGVDVQDDYLEFAEKIIATDMLLWKEALEREQVQINNIPAFWVATPTWDSVIHRDYK